MSDRVSSSASLEISEEYDNLESLVSNGIHSGPLFLTDADPNDLWAAYINGIPSDRRQHYNCNACRHFIQRYGGLASLYESGRQRSALWDIGGPRFFQDSVHHLRDISSKAKIVGVFLSEMRVLGSPMTGEWTHLFANNPKPFADRVKTSQQVMAEKVEDYKMLCHGLADYSRETVEQAVRVLKADALDRSEKTLGIAEWFLELHNAIRANPKGKRNLTWLAVATAPPGFCHVRSTMINTLLDDINAGLSFEVIARKWKEKMHPLQYQRPTAPPKAGAIAEAEKLVAKLGIERSLLRRYATLDDVLTKLWVPRELPKSQPLGGVFDHLRNTGAVGSGIEIPVVSITWDKFRRTVLDNVYQMEILVPTRGGFCGVLTAVDPEAPPILQWDGLAGRPRNPVSWYFYHGGSFARSWGLSAGFCPVTCVFPNPAKWQEPTKFTNQVDRIHFAIAGCVEQRASTSLGLFPENLKSELHGVRSVIEAHSNKMSPQDPEKGNANGLTLCNANPVTLRVRTAAGWENYCVDRMD